ncbi:MAG TPA: hypothetical protein VNL94_08205 [Candidatus Binatia bacterium]|nr:hypothetical protein [Candidatus Binatia bacterium]
MARNRPEGGAEFGFSLLPYSADDGRGNGKSARENVAGVLSQSA